MFTERSNPAGATVTLAADQIAVCVIETLARLITVSTVLAFLALCTHRGNVR